MVMFTGSSVAFTGVPRIPPSRPALRASLIPKVKPSGNSPTNSQLATSPRPVTFGMNAAMVWFLNKSRCWLS